MILYENLMCFVQAINIIIYSGEKWMSFPVYNVILTMIDRIFSFIVTKANFFSMFSTLKCAMVSFMAYSLVVRHLLFLDTWLMCVYVVSLNDSSVVSSASPGSFQSSSWWCRENRVNNTATYKRLRRLPYKWTVILSVMKKSWTR